jgi:hypothetical protein
MSWFTFPNHPAGASAPTASGSEPWFAALRRMLTAEAGVVLHPMLAIAGAGILLIAELAACRRAPKPHGPPAASSAAGSTAPRLKLAQPRLQLGTMIQDETVQRRFALSNVGTQPLQVEGVDASRFCRGSIEPKLIPPGGKGQLDVACRSDLYGPLKEQLTIRSNDPEARKTKVELEASVTPLLAFDTSVIDLRMPFGEERSQEVHLIGILLDRARIKRKDDDAKTVDAEILPLPNVAGRVTGFRIRCKGRKPGMNVGNLIVTTGLERPSEIALSYACKVTGTLEVSPTNPYINLKVSGPKWVNIGVRSSQPGFEVLGVHVTEGPFTASFEHADADGQYRVKVTAIDRRIAEDARAASGRLLIISNDRTEPKKELEIFGFGRVNRVEAPALSGK